MHVTLIGTPSNNYFLQVDIKNFHAYSIGGKNSICCCDCSVLTVNCVKDGTLRICMNCFPLQIIAGKCIFDPVESAFILLFISNLEASIQGKK